MNFEDQFKKSLENQKTKNQEDIANYEAYNNQKLALLRQQGAAELGAQRRELLKSRIEDAEKIKDYAIKTYKEEMERVNGIKSESIKKRALESVEKEYLDMLETSKNMVDNLIQEFGSK
jgi:hypothetical protein